MSESRLETDASPLKRFRVDSLAVRVYQDQGDLARCVAREVIQYLRELIAEKGRAHVMLATGNSQIEFLRLLTQTEELDWSKVTCFHMDEYLGIGADHPASFRRYLRERVEEKVKPRKFHYLEGDALLPLSECERYSRLLREHPIDLCCLGVGENGHLAFNDPPVADFEDPYWVKLVKLDQACKQQQVDEGHFPNLEAVPDYAMTVTIPGLCAARKMICIAPEARKSAAIHRALTGEISTECPASYLRHQAHASLELDVESASGLAS